MTNQGLRNRKNSFPFCGAMLCNDPKMERVGRPETGCQSAPSPSAGVDSSSQLASVKGQDRSESVGGPGVMASAGHSVQLTRMIQAVFVTVSFAAS